MSWQTVPQLTRLKNNIIICYKGIIPKIAEVTDKKCMAFE